MRRRDRPDTVESLVNQAKTGTVNENIRRDVIDALNLRAGIREPSLDRVVQIAATALGSNHAAFSVLYGKQQIYIASFGAGLNAVPRDSSICAQVTATEQPLFLEDALATEWRDHPAVQGPSGVRFYAGIPVRSPSGETVGTLCIYDYLPRKLTIGQRRLLGECAGLIEDALSLRTLAVRDGLTGLLNRRAFDVRVHADWRRAYRGNGVLTVAMLDIDYFKLINDRFGHAVGDEVLRKVARIIEQHFRRDMDSIGRYGGEEFALALPEVSLKMAVARVDELREAIKSAKIPNPDSPLGVLTMSAGLACADSPEAFAQFKVSRLMLLADEALYRAKSNGRDRVEF